MLTLSMNGGMATENQEDPEFEISRISHKGVESGEPWAPRGTVIGFESVFGA
jgi:hypothetical protein